LTQEEKKAKLAELRQKLAEKRAKQSKEEVQINKANEALRRKAGQVSIPPCPLVYRLRTRTWER